MRMFERDKDELRAFGIQIETEINDEGETVGYKLSRKDFYLPYLLLASGDGKRLEPKRVTKAGYRALTSLTFEPDELEAISAAASRVTELGDPLLKADAQSAIRKLAFDLPVGATAPSDGTTMLPAASASPSQILEKLNDALLRRKAVTFTYRSMNANETGSRRVQPYGLFFVSSHWYLAGRDLDKAALRNFRVSRMDSVTVDAAKPQTPDYSIPADFNIREHAKSRRAWEIGDGDATSVRVRFTRKTGIALGAASLGAPVADSPDERAFAVRRPDAFARWLLSFGGDVVPSAPDSIVAEFARQVRETSEIYQSSVPDA